ncbi:hypothetical protein NDU88_001701, partial [Pleurodeles waltl]
PTTRTLFLLLLPSASSALCSSRVTLAASEVTSAARSFCFGPMIASVDSVSLTPSASLWWSALRRPTSTATWLISCCSVFFVYSIAPSILSS